MDDHHTAAEGAPLTPGELSKLLPGYRIDHFSDTPGSTSSSIAAYRGIQVSLERNITVKLLPAAVSSQPEIRQAFENDAKTMARLNHQNLIDVYDFGEINGMLYMITEDIDGQSLYEKAHGQHLDPVSATKLIKNVCQGLECAHTAGVLHLGLNPANIFINQSAEAKIVDFGISSHIHNPLIPNSATYSAPEKHTPQIAIDARADLYSLGIIFYELIVGYLPTNPYAPPSSRRNVTTLIDNVLIRALQPNPTERYASATEMTADLDQILDHLATNPQPAIPAKQPLTQTPVSMPTRNLSAASTKSKLPAIITLLITALIGYAAYHYISNHYTPVASDGQKPKTKFILRGTQ